VFTTKTSVVVEVQLHIFLISRIDGSKYSTSRSCPLILDERSRGTQWIESWVCPMPGLASEQTIKISCRSRTIQPMTKRHPNPQQHLCENPKYCKIIFSAPWQKPNYGSSVILLIAYLVLCLCYPGWVMADIAAKVLFLL